MQACFCLHSPLKFGQERVLDGSGVETLEASVPAVAVDPDLLRSGRLAGMTMWRAIFVLAWPVIIESILNATVGLVDTTMAAGISSGRTLQQEAPGHFPFRDIRASSRTDSSVG